MRSYGSHTGEPLLSIRTMASSGLTGLLGGYGSDSDDDGAQDEHAGGAKTGGEAETTKSPEGEESSEDDESDDEDDDDLENEDRGATDDSSGAPSRGNAKSGRESKSPPSTSLLPSVDDLFSSTAGPDFLAAPGAGDDFVVEAMKKRPPRNKSDSDGRKSPTNEAPGGRKRGLDEGARTSSSGVTGEGSGSRSGDTQSAPAAGGKKPKGGSAGPAGPPAEKSKKSGEKVSAKDKVKGQRLRGQSGIGSDFRVWKSDLEMTLRQQYD